MFPDKKFRARVGEPAPEQIVQKKRRLVYLQSGILIIFFSLVHFNKFINLISFYFLKISVNCTDY